MENSTISSVRKLIQGSHTEKALQILIEHIDDPTNKELRSLLSQTEVVSGTYKSIKEENIKGIIKHEDYVLHINKVNNSLLNIVDQIEKIEKSNISLTPEQAKKFEKYSNIIVTIGALLSFIFVFYWIYFCLNRFDYVFKNYEIEDHQRSLSFFEKFIGLLLGVVYIKFLQLPLNLFKTEKSGYSVLFIIIPLTILVLFIVPIHFIPVIIFATKTSIMLLGFILVMIIFSNIIDFASQFHTEKKRSYLIVKQLGIISLVDLAYLIVSIFATTTILSYFKHPMGVGFMNFFIG